MPQYSNMNRAVVRTSVNIKYPGNTIKLHSNLKAKDFVKRAMHGSKRTVHRRIRAIFITRHPNSKTLVTVHAKSAEVTIELANRLCWVTFCKTPVLTPVSEYGLDSMLDDELDLQPSAMDECLAGVFQDLWENGNHSDHTFENVTPAEERLDTLQFGSFVDMIGRPSSPISNRVLENMSMFQGLDSGFESAAPTEEDLDKLSSRTKALELVELDSY